MSTCNQGEKYAAGTFPAAGEMAIIEWSKKSEYYGHKSKVYWQSASGVGYAYEAYGIKYTADGPLHTIMAKHVKAIYKCSAEEAAGDPEPLENNAGALERSITNHPQIFGGRRRRKSRSRKIDSRRQLRKRTHKH